jgi:hypothetical protein
MTCCCGRAPRGVGQAREVARADHPRLVDDEHAAATERRAVVERVRQPRDLRPVDRGLTRERSLVRNQPRPSLKIPC